MSAHRTSRGISTRLFAVLRLISLTAWIALLLWLSLDPAPPMPSNGFSGFDKLLHAAFYFTLIILTSWACAVQAGFQRAVLLLVGAAAILLGGLLEIAQGVLTSTRSAEFGDFLANGIGVGAAICALQLENSWLKQTASKRERQATLQMTAGGDIE